MSGRKWGDVSAASSSSAGSKAVSWGDVDGDDEGPISSPSHSSSGAAALPSNPGTQRRRYTGGAHAIPGRPLHLSRGARSSAVSDSLCGVVSAVGLLGCQWYRWCLRPRSMRKASRLSSNLAPMHRERRFASRGRSKSAHSAHSHALLPPAAGLFHRRPATFSLMIQLWSVLSSDLFGGWSLEKNNTLFQQTLREGRRRTKDECCLLRPLCTLRMASISHSLAPVLFLSVCVRLLPSPCA